MYFFILSGTKNTDMCFFPVKLACFKNSTTSWVGFSGGQHHTVCLDAEGRPPRSVRDESTTDTSQLLWNSGNQPQRSRMTVVL